MDYWNYRKTSHIKNIIEHRKKEENKGDVANAVTEEMHDALLPSVNSPIDYWVLDLKGIFPHNCTPRNEGKLCFLELWEGVFSRCRTIGYCGCWRHSSKNVKWFYMEDS